MKQENIKRIIKFRLWDGQSVKQVHTMYTNVSQVNWPTPKDDYNFQCRKNETLLQFTGVKDKYGKEIYEGDIVSFRDNVMEVYFGNGFWLLKNNLKRRTLNMCHSHSLIIIGNIYEDIHLIEQFRNQ